MNSGPELHGDDDADFLALYRSLSRETAPAPLDATIIAAAAAGTGSAGAKPLLKRWFRPFAFAAIAVLSFTLVLQMSNQPVPDSSPSQQETSFEAAGRTVAEQVRQAEESAGNAMNSGSVAIEDVVPDASPAVPAERQTDGCSALERDDASSWWQCVDALERAGSSLAAERELQRLLAAFPQFSAPE